MKLSYRGVSYETQPSTLLEMMEGEIGGQYRGQGWNYRYPRHIPQLKPQPYRQYRGVGYGTHSPSQTTISDFTTPTSSGQYCPIPIQKPTKVFVCQTTKTHIENVRRNLERRLQVAKTSGDDRLVHLLEQESQQLAHHT
jgi:hypothetical protein